ncbi:hypothetical protein C0J52_19042 [Blattella germanica]|nr:hypothetical protein C0J52_19042 [Blattella germanica]
MPIIMEEGNGLPNPPPEPPEDGAPYDDEGIPPLPPWPALGAPYEEDGAPPPNPPLLPPPNPPPLPPPKPPLGAP